MDTTQDFWNEFFDGDPRNPIQLFEPEDWNMAWEEPLPVPQPDCRYKLIEETDLD